MQWLETQEACLNVRSRVSELKLENKRGNKSESIQMNEKRRQTGQNED